MPEFHVTFAKVKVQSRDEEFVVPLGVFFGGVTETKPEAEEIARDIVNAAKGFTALPKIFECPRNSSLIDIMYQAEEEFEKLIKGMREVDAVHRRDLERHHEKNRRPVRKHDEAIS